METLTHEKSLVERTYDALLDAISAGELLPGDRLNQDELAARLNVSRQPVNSAISILKANGFAQDTGRRGAVVTALTQGQLLDIYDYRLIVEPAAVRLATARLPAEAAEQAKPIMAAGQRAVDSQDGRALVQADADFHQMIYQWCGNHVIVNSMQANWIHIRMTMAKTLQEPDLARKSWDAHEAILTGMLDRDEDVAATSMRIHIETARQLTLD